MSEKLGPIILFEYITLLSVNLSLIAQNNFKMFIFIFSSNDQYYTTWLIYTLLLKLIFIRLQIIQLQNINS